jgi:hypothetical protein
MGPENLLSGKAIHPDSVAANQRYTLKALRERLHRQVHTGFFRPSLFQ